MKRLTWTSNTEPQEVISANDRINDYLFYIETMGCGIRDAGKSVCEDFACEDILEIIELLEPVDV